MEPPVIDAPLPPNLVMNDRLTHSDAYFLQAVGIGMEALLAHVSVADPAGVPAAEDENYRRIRHERQEEDSTLPLGAWERELKRANWLATSELAAKSLAGRSKDLQLAAWLFEALLARTGFQALGPCLTLIESLFIEYGERLHPQDNEHRINLLQWINQKLLAPIRKIPLTATGEERDYAWNDWEQAQRNEQLRLSLGKSHESQLEGATLGDVGAALACTPYQRIQFLQTCLRDGLESLQSLESTLDAHFSAEDAPGFGAIRNLLERVDVVLAAEARRRGVVAPAVQDTVGGVGDASPDRPGTDMPQETGAFAKDRHEAYVALTNIAQALERIEPHSPVPYLIRRAVAWGGLNTAELYSEVFVRCGGQINIFELLGLDGHIAGSDAQANG